MPERRLGAAKVQHAGYRGVDRRSRSAGLVMQLPATRVLPMWCIVGLGAGVPAFFLGHIGIAALDSYFGVATGLLCVVAGGTWLVMWRVTGRASQGWLGPALIVLGIVTVLADGLGTAVTMRPFDNAIGAIVASGLVLRAHTDREVNAGLNPFLVLLVSLAIGVMGVGGLSLAAAVLRPLPSWTPSVLTVTALHAGVLGVWLAVTVVGARPAVRMRNTTTWVVCVTALASLASAVRLLEPEVPATTIVASAFFFGAAALALGTVIVRLQDVLRVDDHRQLGLHQALDVTCRRAAADQESLEEWLHDIRNAVAGLQAADAVLRSGPNGGLASHGDLANALTAELARLHALVDPRHQLELDDVDLESLVRPIVAAERALGAQVELRVETGAVRADPEALGRVFQNLLENARRHAWGTKVSITAEPRGDAATITVRDGGPGIPPDERASVFERGTRGREDVGSGLGLFVARSLVTAMGGEIELLSDDLPGCGVAITLRLAPAVTITDPHRVDRARLRLEPALGA
jgi:signal transduction histidine kinase